MCIILLLRLAAPPFAAPRLAIWAADEAQPCETRLRSHARAAAELAKAFMYAQQEGRQSPPWQSLSPADADELEAASERNMHGQPSGCV